MKAENNDRSTTSEGGPNMHKFPVFQKSVVVAVWLTSLVFARSAASGPAPVPERSPQRLAAAAK